MVAGLKTCPPLQTLYRMCYLANIVQETWIEQLETVYRAGLRDLMWFKYKCLFIICSRREVVHDVMEMSQWGAMSGWVKAIQQDIRWASQMVALSQTQNLNLLYTVDKIKEEQKSIEKNLKNDLQLVRTQLVAGILK